MPQRKPLLSISLLLLLFAQNSHAYLDPGTGSILLQVIFGGIAGLLIAGKVFWHRILVFLRIKKPPVLDDEPGEDKRESEA